MSVAALALLVGGVAVVLVSCLGVLVMPTPLDKLHYVGPASTLGALLIAAALAVDAPAGEIAAKQVFTALLLTVSAPAVTAATAKAAHRGGDEGGRDSAHGGWDGADDRADPP